MNILEIHRNILEEFNDEKKNINIKKERIKDIEKFLKKNLTLSTKQKLQKELESLNLDIEKIENETTHSYYILETHPIIEKYKKCITKPKKVSFMGVKKNDAETLKRKKEIEEKYLDIVSKYTSINHSNKVSKELKFSCDSCNSENFDNNDGIETCMNCGKIRDELQTGTSYKDSSRINFSLKFTYERKIHFKNCIDQFQGKENVKIPQKVYDQLILEFKNHDLLINNKDKHKQFSNITKKHVYMFLKETGNSRYYDNFRLIHYNLTGEKPNNIGNLEEKLMYDIELLSEKYEKKMLNEGNIERKSFINSQYVLFQLLSRHKYPCIKEDFNLLKTIDRKHFHEEICKELFTELGWNFTPLI